MDHKEPMSSTLPRRAVIGLLSAAIAVAAMPAAVLAKDSEKDEDHDRARHALERGEILSLDKVMAVVRDRVGGDVVGVELERDDERWIYEFKVLRPDGRVVEVTVDAASARILKGGGK